MTPLDSGDDRSADESLADFTGRLRSWLCANVDRRAIAGYDLADRRRVTAAMYDAGFMGVTWPPALGGRGLSADYQTAFNTEIAPYEGAVLPSVVTVGICAATLLDCATTEQKRRHIPRMLRGDESWTQLLSEPGAGSDLASVTTSAVRDGTGFVVNGQKIWTSLAHESDHALALVRTSGAAGDRAGLTMVIVDLHAPGVDIRPLLEMTGDAVFNEVFLDDVAVAETDVLGAVGGGWPVLRRMLTHERIALSAGTTGGRMDAEAFPRLLTLAVTRGELGDPGVREALTEVYVQQRVLEYLGVRMRAALDGGAELGAIGSVGKIATARAARVAAEATVRVGGAGVLAWPADDAEAGELAKSVLHFPMTGIAGGTTEMQKNIVAERLLGLPRDGG